MKKKYFIDIEQFINKEKITKESAYILGLCWADGTLGQSYSMTITCISSDLDLLLDVFSKTGNWGIYRRKPNGNRQPQTTFYISDKILFDFLQKQDYHVKSKESADKVLNCIPDNLHEYWWRGYFDGDGCIYTGLNNQLFFTGPFDQNWNFVEKLKINLDWRIVQKTTKTGSYSRRIVQNKKEILKFCQFIYEHREEDKIGFERKYNKFLGLKTHEKLILR
jgi:hypothetical protein